MGHKTKVHELFDLIAEEVLAFIKESESGYSEGWVPATFIKNQLGLKLSAYPQGNKIDNKTGWLFSTIARHLQDKNLVEFRVPDRGSVNPTPLGGMGELVSLVYSGRCF